MATKCGEHIQSGDIVQRDDSPFQQDGTGHVKFHHTRQNGARFKIYELFLLGIFHLIFLDLGWLWVTETKESETTDKVGTSV